MNNDIYMKEYIRQFNKNLDETIKDEIIYRVVNINNMYYYGEEISTGCIFPIYYFTNSGHKNYNGGVTFHSQSNALWGKYFVYCSLQSHKERPFQFSAEVNRTSKEAATVEEINQYLKEKRRDTRWQKKIKEMEEENRYYCELNLIKNLINNEKEKELENVKKITIASQEQLEKLDILEIKEFGIDLSEKSELCTLIGRDEEKKKIIKSVCIGRDSILLIGPPGAGKTVLIESIAKEIKNNSNNWLRNKTIFSLNLYTLLSDTNYRGSFEKKIEQLISFCLKNKERIILFIDEIHTLYGLGRTEDSSIDAMNILKPYIENKDIIIIGATTNDEFLKYMANDPAFIRRFEKINISPPTIDMNIEIIVSYIEELKAKYNITFEEQENIIEIASYIINITDPKRQKAVGDIKIENPTLAKKIIKDAFIEAIYNQKSSVGLEEISYAINTCDRLPQRARETIIEQIGIKRENKVSSNNNLTLVKRM